MILISFISESVELKVLGIGVAVKANPFMADKDLINGAELKGKIAVIQRGVVNFSEKAKRAQDAGAVGVLFVSTKPAKAVSYTHLTLPTILLV